MERLRERVASVLFIALGPEVAEEFVPGEAALAGRHKERQQGEAAALGGCATR